MLVCNDLTYSNLLSQTSDRHIIIFLVTLSLDFSDSVDYHYEPCFDYDLETVANYGISSGTWIRLNL